MAKGEIGVLLKEKRIFEPPAELVENSNVKKWMSAGQACNSGANQKTVGKRL